jgi:putative membrane protein
VSQPGIASLLWGTVVHRPYVYAFFACFLAFAFHQLGVKRTVTFAVSTWLMAFAAEYSSTRNGFPFGLYSYVDATRTRELWIANVPFWDSLSFVFLSYFSYVLAAALLSRPISISRVRGEGRADPPVSLSPGRGEGRGAGWSGWPGFRHPAAPLVGGAVMMLLDVVIDPVALQGDKWFLGRIYEYPYRGFYFGVTAANFAGWFLVGAASQWAFQLALRVLPWCRGPWRAVHPRFVWAVYALYAAVFGFNLAMTIVIRDHALAAASAAVVAVTLSSLAWRLRAPSRLA